MRMEYEFRMPEEYERLRLQLNVLKPGTFWIDSLNVIESQTNGTSREGLEADLRVGGAAR